MTWSVWHFPNFALTLDVHFAFSSLSIADLARFLLAAVFVYLPTICAIVWEARVFDGFREPSAEIDGIEGFALARRQETQVSRFRAREFSRKVAVFGYPNFFAGLALNDPDRSISAMSADHPDQITLALSGVACEGIGSARSPSSKKRLGDRAVLPLGQADTADPQVPRHVRERSAHSDFDCSHRLCAVAAGACRSAFHPKSARLRTAGPRRTAVSQAPLGRGQQPRPELHARQGGAATGAAGREWRDGRASVRHDEGAHGRATHFLMKTLPKVAAEVAMHVLAYNLTRALNIVGTSP